LIVSEPGEGWPALPLDAWQETYATLHMYSQVVGKVRLALSPMVNQWWQVPLYLTARGLTTSPIPDPSALRTFEMRFDFLDHRLVVETSSGEARGIALGGAVKDFYRVVMDALGELGIDVRIWTMPVEVLDPIPFDQDDRHATYDPVYAHRFWQILRQADVVLQEFRGRFTGKSSPVHFFWGSFDLAVTRFSGRPAPPPEGADLITALGYNAELSSVGFWPGGPGISGTIDGAAFYAYAYPEPAGFRDRPVRPEGAFYHAEAGEFLLMYDDVRASADPRQAILDFAQSTYEAGARLQGWPIEELELRREEAEAVADRDPSAPTSELAASKAPNPEAS
jgi:hypothetical protein